MDNRHSKSNVSGLTQRVPVDPFAAARIRGEAARERLIQRAGGLLSLDEVARRLRCSPDEVLAMRDHLMLLAVPTGDDEDWKYPACQFDGDRLVSGLEAFLSELSNTDPWMRLAVFLAPSSRYDKRCALDLLKEGKKNEARGLAALFAGAA